MAKGRIENSDLFAPDLGKDAIKTFKKLNKVLDISEERFKEMLQASIDVNKQIPKTNKQIQDFNKSIIAQQKAVVGLEKVEQQRIKTRQQEELLTQKAIKSKIEEKKNSVQSIKVKQQALRLSIQEAKEKERLLKIEKREAESKRKLNSEYEKAKIKLNGLAKKLKEVAFVEGKNAKSTKRLAKEYDLLRNKVFAAEKVAGEFQRNVGNYPKTLSKVTGALQGLGLAFGGLAIIRNVFNTVKDFEQSIANLSAITGATGKDLDFLKDKAIELGSTTTLSATQVAEGFKLIASAKPELLGNAEALTQVTESAITLAEAAGIELPEAASALANSLNQFGEGAESAAKFVDTLAAGSKFGAGDINFLNEALVSSGTVAKDAGLGIQETVAALELFAEKGIPASKAGNSFKNVLLNLQKQGKGFVNGKFNLQAAISQVNKELDEIQDPSKKAAASINLFGKENITTGKILLQNNGRLTEMTEAVDANGIALEQQAINNDTLQGALKAVASAWEGFILKLEEGTGAFGFLKNVLFFVAENLNTIVRVVGTLTVAFGIYKAIDKTTKAFKALSTVMKANPYALIASAIATITIALIAWSQEMTTAEKVAQTLLDVQEEAARSTIKQKTELKSLLIVAKDKEQSDENRKKAIEAINKISPEYLGNLTLENINTAEGTKLINGYVNALNRKAVAQAAQSKLVKLNEKLFDVEQKQLKEFVTATDISAASRNNLLDLEARGEDLSKRALSNRKDEIASVNAEIKAVNDLINAKVKSGDIDIDGLGGGADTSGSGASTSNAKRKVQLDEGIGDYLNFIEEDKELKAQRLLEEQQADDILLDEYDAFYDESKKLTKEHNDWLDQEYDRQINDYDDFIDEDKELKRLRLEQEQLNRQKAAEFLGSAADVINNVLKKRSEERIALLDKEIAANKSYQSELQLLAAKGVVNAEENIAFEKKQAAKLELFKQKEIERQARQELAITAIKTYSGYVQGGEKGGAALAKTVTDIEFLKTFIGTLDLFFEGTEDTGTVDNPLDSNGGRLAVLHDNERVMSAKQNKAIGHLSNDQLASIGSNYSSGEANINKAMQLQRFESNNSVLAKFDKLENAISDIDIPNVEFHYDSIRDSFVKTIESKNKIERIHHKKSQLW